MWRLSIAWGTPIWLLDSMPGSLLDEAMIYYQLEPFGAERDNLHAGLICSTLANLKKAKGTQPAQAKDFLFKFKSSDEIKQSKRMALHSVLSRYAVVKDD